MAYSTQRVVSDGSLVLLSVSIGYLERSHIRVFFDNVENALPWAWVGPTGNQISFSPAVPNGVEVIVARKTDLSAPYHVFTQGAQFTAESLDEDIAQILYIAQEATEQALTGDFYQNVNMHNYRIINVADAVDPQDVMTFGQAQETMQPYVDAAAASVLAASNSAIAADISEANALASEVAAAASAVAAASATVTQVNAGATNAVLKTSGTGSMKVPAGTTAERDVAPVYGAQRANSTLNIQEWWNGSAWVAMGGMSQAASEAAFLQVDGGNQMIAPLVFDTNAHSVVKVGAAAVAQFPTTCGIPFMKNKLINGEVTRINQRGVANWAAVANGTYGYDRWKKIDASNMTQIIEAGNFRPNTVHTLSGIGVTTQQITSPASGNWTLPNIPIAATNIQVEEGLEATPFEVRHIWFELGLCQRYYQSRNFPITTAYGVVTTTQHFIYPLLCQMRAVPTVVVISGMALTNCTGLNSAPQADVVSIYVTVTSTGSYAIGNGVLGIAAEL